MSCRRQLMMVKRDNQIHFTHNFPCEVCTIASCKIQYIPEAITPKAKTAEHYTYLHLSTHLPEGIVVFEDVVNRSSRHPLQVQGGKADLEDSG